MNIKVLLVAATFVLTGCSVMRTDVTVDPRPLPIGALASAPPFRGASISSVTVSDNRLDIFTGKRRIDPRVLLNKRVEHNIRTEGVWAAERPLGEYVKQAFEDALSQVSVSQSASSLVELRVQIDELVDDERTGFIRSDIYLNLVATVVVVDRTSGKALWRERVYGGSKVAVSGLFIMGSDFAQSLPRTIASLVEQCLSSQSFRSALESRTVG